MEKQKYLLGILLKKMNDLLEELPAKIAYQEAQVVDAEKLHALMKVKNAVAKARKTINYSALKNLTTQQQQAKVTIDMEKEDIQLVTISTRVKEKRVELNRLINQFLVLRKQVNLQIAEMQHLE